MVARFPDLFFKQECETTSRTGQTPRCKAMFLKSANYVTLKLWQSQKFYLANSFNYLTCLSLCVNFSRKCLINKTGSSTKQFQIIFSATSHTRKTKMKKKLLVHVDTMNEKKLHIFWSLQVAQLWNQSGKTDALLKINVENICVIFFYFIPINEKTVFCVTKPHTSILCHHFSFCKSTKGQNCFN